MDFLMSHINSTRRSGLDGSTPYELVETPELVTLLELLGLCQIPADEVKLKSSLLKILQSKFVFLLL
jgi:hypothetical protein